MNRKPCTGKMVNLLQLALLGSGLPLGAQIQTNPPAVTSAPFAITSASPAITSASPAITSASPAITSASPAITSASPAITSASPAVTSAPPAAARPARTLRLPVPPVERILTEDQKICYHNALQANREKVKELELQLHNARVAIAQVQLADKFDEDEFRQKTAVADKIQLEISLLNAYAFRKIHPLLTAEQLERLRVATPPMRPPAAPTAGGERPGSEGQPPPEAKTPAPPAGTNAPPP